MSTDIKERISTMGYLFVLEGMAYPSITAIDSTLIKANGHVWHKSPMKKELYHILALIQMQDGGGYSHTKEGWVFGYKLHLTSTTATATGDLVVPLTAEM